jgi:hypothetical protein
VLEAGGILVVVFDIHGDRARAAELVDPAPIEAPRPLEGGAVQRWLDRPKAPISAASFEASSAAEHVFGAASAQSEQLRQGIRDVLTGNVRNRVVAIALLVTGVAVRLAANILSAIR